MKELVFNRVVRHGTTGIPNDLLWSYAHIGLNADELAVVLILFAFGQKKNDFYPDLAEVGDVMNKDVSEVQELIASLMEKDCLSIEREFSLEHQAALPAFSFDPLFKKLGSHIVALDNKKREIHQEKMLQTLAEKELAKEEAKSQAKEKDIITIFEEEFGRLLSNTERAYIMEWLEGDSYSETLVLEALRSAVSRDKLNFKYIDTILRDWERKGIRTAKQARKQDQKAKGRKTQKTQKTTRVSQNFPDKDTEPRYDDLVVNLME